MPLPPGDQLGPYEILVQIGEGGMGDVYKARDTRLDRTVAIKVSKEAFSERFEREARAVAALNHPNICTLHDVGPNYLVMEYIEGTPLKGPLPIDQALNYAAQICDALDAAHKKNITHRDLKPANILVTRQGIKLLDFGLAKVAPVVRADEATMTMALTGKGEILGTLLYMSPEQISGQEADARSDIFSFGLVLYEMLTGKRAFEGATPANVMGAILERPAPSIAEVAPPGLDRVLKRCLEKDPDNRWQSARDVKASFDLITPVVPERPNYARPSGLRKWLWGMAALLAVAVAVFVGVQYGKAKPAAARQVVRFQIPVQPATGLRPIAAIAPDGLSLAYFDTFADGHIAIKIRAMDSGIATEFPASEMAQPTYMFWSPDSKTIYFGNRRFLKRMDVSRRTVQQICDCSSDSGAMNQDGVILLGGSPLNPAITRISTTGETATLHKAARTGDLPSSPAFLPDGRRFLFAEGGGIFLTSIDRPQAAVRRVADVPDRFTLVQGASGSFFMLRQSNSGTDVLPFDVQKGEIAGPPLALPLAGEQTTPSVSNTGVLLRLMQVETRQVAVWFDRQGKQLGEAAATEGYGGVDLSPDGGRLALISPGGLWVRDLERGTATRLAPQVQASGSAIWSPDGMSVVFAAQDKTRVQRLYRADASNTRPESLLLDEPGLHWPNDWSRDGKYLLYGFDEGKTSRDLWVLRMDEPGAKPIQYTHGASTIKQGQFSPDGRFVAYTSDESGRFETYVQPFPDASKGKWVISQAGGVGPLWSRDGRELFFFSGQKMMVVDVRVNGGSFSASAPRELFSAQVPAGFSNDSHRWQLSPDGKRFLVMVPSSGAASAYLDVVVNWETLLKQ